MGVEAIYPKRSLSRSGAGHRIYPYLLELTFWRQCLWMLTATPGASQGLPRVWKQFQARKVRCEIRVMILPHDFFLLLL